MVRNVLQAAAAVLLIVLNAAGCTSVVPASADLVQPTPAALLGRFTTPPAVEPSAIPLTPAAPTAVQVLAPVRPTAAPLPTATLPEMPVAVQVEPTQAPFQVCTPIAEILLADLPRLISDGYHPPPSPRSDARHPAIDIAFYNWKGFQRIAGMPVQAVLAGQVAAAEADSYPFGNVVIVETKAIHFSQDLRAALRLEPDQSLYLLYAHLQEDSLRPKLGDFVTACETLGRVGRTGNSGAAHLHLETRSGPGEVTFEGFSYYSPAASKTDKENYRRWATSGEFRHFDPLRLLLWELGYSPTLTPAGNWSEE